MAEDLGSIITTMSTKDNTSVSQITAKHFDDEEPIYDLPPDANNHVRKIINL